MMDASDENFEPTEACYWKYIIDIPHEEMIQRDNKLFIKFYEKYIEIINFYFDFFKVDQRQFAHLDYLFNDETVEKAVETNYNEWMKKYEQWQAYYRNEMTPKERARFELIEFKLKKLSIN